MSHKFKHERRNLLNEPTQGLVKQLLDESTMLILNS
jgi:hypothetical protein